eukprot:g42087.t1
MSGTIGTVGSGLTPTSSPRPRKAASPLSRHSRRGSLDAFNFSPASKNKPRMPVDPVALADAKKHINKSFELYPLANFPRPKKIVELSAKTTVKEAADILLKSNVLSAPVYNPDARNDAQLKDKYVGLVDMSDIAHCVLRLLGAQRDHKSPAAGTPVKTARKASWASFDFFAQESALLQEITVGEICGESCQNPFVPVSSKGSLRDALLILGKEHVYRFPVVDEEGKQIVNFITQSSLLRAMASKKEVFSALTSHSLEELGLAKEKKVIYVNATDPALLAFQLITQHRIGGIPVLGVDGKVLANISARDFQKVIQDGDLFAALFKPLTIFLSILFADSLQDLAPSICCRPSATLAYVIALLARRKIHRIYVIDDASRLISVVSLTDVLTVFSLDSDLSTKDPLASQTPPASRRLSS